MERRKLTKEDIDKVRNIEGFPIGTDEDIIALSDAPYYTACPNPFIEEFIKENGTPYDEATDDYHREPFATDVSESKSDDLYNMHTYHTKVPPMAIAKHILYYTKPGDIILDSFCGTGMTGLATAIVSNDDNNYAKLLDNRKSLIGHRSVILNDLSPVATYIASSYNSRGFDSAAAIAEGKLIIKEFNSVFQSLYSINHNEKELSFFDEKGKINYVVWSDIIICPFCGKEIIYSDVTLNEEGIRSKENIKCSFCGAEDKQINFSRATETYYDKYTHSSCERIKEYPVLVNYSFNGKKFERRPSAEEAKSIILSCDAFEATNITIERFPDGEKTSTIKKSHKIEYFHQLYNERSLVAFSWLWDRINKINSIEIRNILRFSLQAIAIGFTKTNRYFASSYSQVNRYLKGTYYIAPIRAEVSPEYAWKGKIEKLGKLISNFNCCISTGSATNLLIPNNSVDYIFIDPPFGSNLMYSDLNIIWEYWLKVTTNNKQEAIVSNFQKKGINEYLALMQASIKELYRVLKPGRWITVEFHNSNNKIWTTIQNAIQTSGFVIADVRILDKVQQTMNQYSAKSSVDKDLIISAYKPKEGFIKTFVVSTNSKESVWDFVRLHLSNVPVVVNNTGKIEIIAERQSYLLFDRMVAYHIMQRVAVPIDAQEFYKGLDDRFIKRDGMYFLPSQVNEYDEARSTSELVDVQLSMFVSDEKSAIGWLYGQLVEPQTYQVLQPKFMQEVKAIDKHEKMPELMTILEENFLKDDEGKWYIPDLSKSGDVAKLREKNLLKEFQTYLASTGKLKVFRLEAIRAGFAKLWKEKDYANIVKLAERLPEETVQEDSNLLMYYDISLSRI